MTYTINDIRALRPCYDPSRYLPEDWQGTALDVLNIEACPAEDRLWVVLREGWIDERTLRLFAVWCARQALALVKNPDPRSVTACGVAERYANGEATAAELAAARAAVWAAALAARATSDAALAATRAAALAASDAASDAAWAAALAATQAAGWDAQVDHLRAMLQEAQP